MTVLSKEQVLSAFKNRKSCRHYDAARKISAEDFQFILELGRLSPSSVGSEPWQFVVVQNPEIRQAIKLFSWGMADALDTASHLVVFLAKKNARFDSPFMLESLKRRGVTEPDAVEKSLARYQAFQADDIKILDDSRALFDWCCRQTYIALANMMTGAAMAGIGFLPGGRFQLCRYGTRIVRAVRFVRCGRMGRVRCRDIRLPGSGNRHESAQALGRNRYLGIRQCRLKTQGFSDGIF